MALNGWSCVHKPVGSLAQSSSPTRKRREHTKPTPKQGYVDLVGRQGTPLGSLPSRTRFAHVLLPCLVPSFPLHLPFSPLSLPFPSLPFPASSFLLPFCSFFLFPPSRSLLFALPTPLPFFLPLLFSHAPSVLSFPACPQPPPRRPAPLREPDPKRESCLSSTALLSLSFTSIIYLRSLPSVVLCLPLQSSLPMMSKNQLAYHHHHRQFAAAASTIASPLPSPAMSLSDSNPWSNITTPTLPASNPTHHSIKGLSTPSVVYSNSTQPIISFEGSSQPKNVINDVFLSSTMLYDDVERYLHESSSSSFDSDSDSGFSTPSQHDEEHQNCFSTPMTPMSPFMESDTEDQLYPAEEEDVQTRLPEQAEQCQETKQESDGNNIPLQQATSFLRSPHNRSPV